MGFIASWLAGLGGDFGSNGHFPLAETWGFDRPRLGGWRPRDALKNSNNVVPNIM